MNSNIISARLFCGACLISMISTAGFSQNETLVGNQINLAKNVNPNTIPESINDKVNTMFVESGPIPTSNGKRLYYSRFGHPDNVRGKTDMDIWFNEFDEATGKWSESINMGQPLNNKAPNFICEVGLNGDTLFVANVYEKNGKMKAGLSYSVRSGESWSAPVAIYLSKFNMSDKTDYDVSYDRKVLLMAHQRLDSRGGQDLYVLVKDGKGGFGGTEAVNLGSVINSFGDETSPFLSEDGQTLFFSSNGHNGYGKLDVFKSTRLDDSWTNWSKPENLGPTINTAFDDDQFSYNRKTRYAFYSRGISDTQSDIYRVDVGNLFNFR